MLGPLQGTSVGRSIRFGAAVVTGGVTRVPNDEVCSEAAVILGPHRSPHRSTAAAVVLIVALLAILASSAQAKEVHQFESQITGTCPATGNCPAAERIPFSTPFGLATDGSDNLWLTDTGGPVVDKFEPGGAFLGQGDGGGHFSEHVESLAFSTAAEHTFVADSGEDDLWVLNSDTSYLEPGGKESIKGPWGTGCCFIRVAADNWSGEGGGDLYVSSGGESTITRIDAKESAQKGEAVPAPFSGSAPFVSGDQLTGPFSNPRSVAVAADGTIYVADGSEHGTIFEFEPSGELAAEFTTVGGTAFGEITALAVDPTGGSLLVAERAPSATQGTISELTSSGALKDRITGANGGAFGQIRGLATDSIGRLYVADAPNHVVDVFGPLTPLPVEIDLGSVSRVASTSADLNAQISPNGIETSYTFQYGTVDCGVEPAACTDIPSPPANLGAPEASVDVVQHLTGLKPGTRYFYRLIATDDQTAEQIVGPVHTFTTQTASPFALPDSRQWEMVSPPDKHGARIFPISELGTIQAAANGDAMGYVASAPTESGPQGNTNQTSVLSSRGSDGWTSRDLSIPHNGATGPSVGQGIEVRIFSSDLSQAIVQPFGSFVASLSSEASEQTAFLRADFPTSDPTAFCTTSCYRPLVTGCPPAGQACSPNIEGLANVPPGAEFGTEVECTPQGQHGQTIHCGPEFVGATAELGHIVLAAFAPLTPGAPDGEIGFGGQLIKNLYEWSGNEPPSEQLQLISVRPGSAGPAPASSVPIFGSSITDSARNAISPDGSRVIWSEQAGEEGLYLRDTASEETVQLGGRGAAFQAATAGTGEIFFTEGGDLFRYDVEAPEGEHLSDLTPAGGVLGSIPGVAEDGSSVYFVANGVLATNSGPGGDEAASGDCGSLRVPRAEQTCNLYSLQGGHLTYIARLSAEDDPDWGTTANKKLGTQTARVSPNGRWLAFMSERPLTGYDNRDASSDKSDQEVFLYHEAPSGGELGKLVCASCNPTGARPLGVEYHDIREGFGIAGGDGPWQDQQWLAANVPAWSRMALSIANLYQPRYLSDSGRLFFNSSDALVPQDSNGTEDVYQYEPADGQGAPPADTCESTSSVYSPAAEGCIALISSGTSAEESAFLDASESGNDVFFLTAAQLSSRDTDTSLDIYDARVSGGEPEPLRPVECEGDGCQQPAVPPNDATPGSLTFSGAGNVKECPEGKQLKQGKCVKQKAKKSKKKKHKKGKSKDSSKKKGKKQKRANSKGGGQK
jgi:hypothetical protein